MIMQAPMRMLTFSVAVLAAAFNVAVLSSSSVGQCPENEGQNGEIVLSTLCRQPNGGAGQCFGCMNEPSNFQDLILYSNSWIDRPSDPPNLEFPNPSAPTMILCSTLKPCKTTTISGNSCDKVAGTCTAFGPLTACTTAAYGVPTPMNQGDFQYCD